MVILEFIIGENFDHGAFLDDYKIEGEIGEGGFGKVYKATHKVTGDPVAVKYMDISDYCKLPLLSDLGRHD